VRRAAVAALALAALLVGCGSAGPAPAAPRAAAGPAAPTATKVAVVVMENKEAGDVLGSPRAPYLTGLARRYAHAAHSFGVTHPSLPNYLALVSGSTHGITSNCTACHVGARNLADQLEARGVSWKAYLQGLPRPCFQGAYAGRYAKKHNPFIYFDSVARRPARCAKIVPYARLSGDLRGGRLPRFSLVTPDLCADTHDCPVSTGDRFLKNLVPRLLRAVGRHGFVVVTYDEGTTDEGCCGGSRGGRIATVVAGPDVRRGYAPSTPVDHYGVLRTVEQSLGLPLLGAARDPRHGGLGAMFRRR
jgi:phosphatidylinositol-3-phosphatase